MTPERHRLVMQRLAQRQPDLSVLLEQVHKVHNFSAVLRSCDAVGVYRAHAVPPPGGLPLASGTAQGAEKWVRVVRHPDVGAAAAALKGEGFTLLAAHLSEGAQYFRAVDLTRPVCFVLGGEKEGVSAAALALVDGAITIPMQGMVESLNVSVACAVMLFEAQRQRLAAGMYERCRLDPAEFERTRFEWLHPKIARHCRTRGLRYPALDSEGEIAEPVPGSSALPLED